MLQTDVLSKIFFIVSKVGFYQTQSLAAEAQHELREIHLPVEITVGVSPRIPASVTWGNKLLGRPRSPEYTHGT